MREGAGAARFWRLAAPWLDTGAAERGTIMGRPCLRVSGEFVAMPHSETGDLIVKLTRDRVDELVAGGSGRPFGPGNKVFREWLAVPQGDDELWTGLLSEAIRARTP